MVYPLQRCTVSGEKRHAALCRIRESGRYPNASGGQGPISCQPQGLYPEVPLQEPPFRVYRSVASANFTTTGLPDGF